jgi:hypothetical protein
LIQLQREGFIEDTVEFIREIAETLHILDIITPKLILYFDNLEPVKQEYFKDPDDPPVQRIGETLYFVKCENYMTYFGLTEFNLEHMLFRINFQRKYSNFNFAQKTREETPEIPMNEYIWYCCPLEMRAVDIQIAYYQHWQKYVENNKVSKKEIDQSWGRLSAYGL